MATNSYSSAPPYDAIHPGHYVGWERNSVGPIWHKVITRAEYEEARGEPFPNSEPQPIFIEVLGATRYSWLRYTNIVFYKRDQYTICALCDSPVYDVHYLCRDCSV